MFENFDSPKKCRSLKWLLVTKKSKTEVSCILSNATKSELDQNLPLVRNISIGPLVSHRALQVALTVGEP